MLTYSPLQTDAPFRVGTQCYCGDVHCSASEVVSVYHGYLTMAPSRPSSGSPGLDSGALYALQLCRARTSAFPWNLPQGRQPLTVLGLPPQHWEELTAKFQALFLSYCM